MTGGKQGLIRTLVDLWSQAPIVAQTLSEVETLTDPDEILRHTAAAVRTMRETYGDIIRLVLSTAPHHPEVAENLRVATTRYRDAIEAVATRLHDVGGLREGTTVAEASETMAGPTRNRKAGWSLKPPQLFADTRSLPPPPPPSPAVSLVAAFRAIAVLGFDEALVRRTTSG